MESRGVEQLYFTSMEKYNVRYRPFVGDGDAHSWAVVSQKLPYTMAFPVEKCECITGNDWGLHSDH